MRLRFVRCLLWASLAAAPAWAGGTTFNIMDYGAKNDGSAPATDAFRLAIQAAKAAGGGTVFVPAGHYVSGPIELVSNMILYLDAGAVGRFPAQHLPYVWARQQSIEAMTPVPLIGGDKLENVTIAGRGLLTGSNEDWMKLMPRQKSSERVGLADAFAESGPYPDLLEKYGLNTASIVDAVHRVLRRKGARALEASL